jgi:hypothetical protein
VEAGGVSLGARVLMAAGVIVLPTLARAQDRAPSRGGGTPIRDSIERVVERVVLAHLAPCELASRSGVPCFPSGIENAGLRFSVAEALRRYRGEGGPAPGVPTVAEIQGQMSGAPQSASGGVGGDPVCAAKNLWKKVRVKGTTYHLYRTWDERGERPLMTDHLLDPDDYRANPQFHFEYLGQYDGECAAVAAWNKALRDAVAPKRDEPDY